MKTTLLILLLFCSCLQAKDLGCDITRVGTGLSVVPARSRLVTFIFDNPCTVLISGVTFTQADVTLTLEAPTGDTLPGIVYNVSVGGLRTVVSK